MRPLFVGGRGAQRALFPDQQRGGEGVIWHREHRLYVTYSFISIFRTAGVEVVTVYYYHDFEYTRTTMLEDVRRAFECAPRFEELRTDLFSSMRVER